MSNIKTTDYVEGLINNLEKNTETIQNGLSTLKTEVEEIKNTSVTDEQISTAVNNYLTEHPVQSGATAEQAAQIQANKTAIGDENSGLIKEVNDIKNTNYATKSYVDNAIISNGGSIEGNNISSILTIIK